jgi:hypothetical protein
MPLKAYDTHQRISHFGIFTSKDCARKKKKNPEARTLEVNIGRPNLEDTWRKIPHFGRFTSKDCKSCALKSIEEPKPELSK